MSASESNPTNFNCNKKKDIANKPYDIGDDTNYFEDPVICSGFIDVQGIPSRPTDIEITNGDVRIYTGNLLVRPGISTFQQTQIEEELYVCKSADIMGDTFIKGTSSYPLQVGGNAFFDHGNIGDLSSRFNAADASPKPFDLVHPTRGEGHRLRYACIEGPEVAVYFRGRLKGSNTILLPYYWTDLVHEDSITVQLTPIGTCQKLYVKEFDNKMITIHRGHGKEDKEIDCFYHVYAERKDINPLITEYEGNSWKDYPDPHHYSDDFENRRYDHPDFAGPPNTKTK
tara:strand:- start:9581 stop:10435 length:855 start_codon:yes stop_codon:yes gene_type:complete